MKKLLTILFATAIVSGCSGTIGNKNMPTSKSKAEKQMPEMTTKAAVREKLGSPNMVFDKDGAEVYEYKSISGHGRYHWLIPIVGYVMYQWQDTYAYTETNLMVTFDKKDKVKSWEIIKTSGTCS